MNTQRPRRLLAHSPAWSRIDFAIFIGDGLPGRSFLKPSVSTMAPKDEGGKDSLHFKSWPGGLKPQRDSYSCAHHFASNHFAKVLHPVLSLERNSDPNLRPRAGIKAPLQEEKSP